jgi:hypothetical protein
MGSEVGQAVQTAFGRGRVVERRNAGRLLIEVHGRLLLLDEADVTPAESQRRARASRRGRTDGAATMPGATGHERVGADDPTGSSSRQVDLHGLTVDEALARLDQVINDALLAGVSELRVIHGRSGGRLRGAVHARLREVAAVGSFALDSTNAGVTKVRFR